MTLRTRAERALVGLEHLRLDPADPPAAEAARRITDWLDEVADRN